MERVLALILETMEMNMMNMNFEALLTAVFRLIVNRGIIVDVFCTFML